MIGIIYFLIKNDEIVYVGQTKSGARRMIQHYHDKGRGNEREFDHVSFIECPVEKLNETEVQYIIKFNPIYNGSTLPSNKRYKSKTYIKKKYRINGNILNKILAANKATVYYNQYYDMEELKEKGAMQEIIKRANVF